MWKESMSGLLAYKNAMSCSGDLIPSRFRMTGVIEEKTSAAFPITLGDGLIKEAKIAVSKCSFAHNNDSKAASGVPFPTSFHVPTGRATVEFGAIGRTIGEFSAIGG